MSPLWRKPWFIFLLGFTIITLVFYFVPLALFDGEVIFNNEVTEWKVPTKLTLKQITGIGITEEELKDVKTYYLVSQGYLLLFLMLLGFPALLAYRFHILNKTEKKENK